MMIERIFYRDLLPKAKAGLHQPPNPASDCVKTQVDFTNFRDGFVPW